MKNTFKNICGALVTTVVCSSAVAETSNADLAKQLANPIASLGSVPFQLNYNEGYGPDGDGDQWLLNVQPVIPFSLNDDWNLITRTIVPLISNDDVIPDSSRDGIGNVLFSAWASPKDPTAAGWIWGLGAAVQLPTSSSDQFGEDQWAVGPTGIALKQTGPWTYGALVNHLWDASGDTDINNTFLQPFLSYTTPQAVTIGVNSESSYDWEGEQWNAPINAFVSKVVPIGKQPVQFQGGIRYWLDSPDNGPDDFGLRFAVTFLFPK